MWEELLASGFGVDAAPAAPAAVAPMEKQSVGIKRRKESKPSKKSKKKGKEEVVAAQSPLSLAPPPPEGFATLAKATAREKPDVKPASKSVPRY
jgi:hypothetical protein